MEEKTTLADTGDRTDMAGTGALRDRPAGKGRCDLLPLKTVGFLLSSLDKEGGKLDWVKEFLERLDSFMWLGDIQYAYNAYKVAVRGMYKNEKLADELLWKLDNQIEMFTQSFLDLSKHYEQGALKYAPYNWCKGLPLSCFIDSAVRHLMQYLQGLDNEPHDWAILWNIICLIWTAERYPELNDLPVTIFNSKENIEGNAGVITKDPDTSDHTWLSTIEDTVSSITAGTVNDMITSAKNLIKDFNSSEEVSDMNAEI